MHVTAKALRRALQADAPWISLQPARMVCLRCGMGAPIPQPVTLQGAVAMAIAFLEWHVSCPLTGAAARGEQLRIPAPMAEQVRLPA